MKKIVMMLLLGSVLTAFIIHKDSTGIENGTELHGYRLRSNAINFNDFNLWVITNEASFNEEFVAENETVIKPVFAHQWVLAAKVETNNYSYKVSFKKMVINNNNLDVYLAVKKIGPSQGGDGPVAISAFPKDKSVKKVNFYHNNVLVKSVPVVAVY